MHKFRAFNKFLSSRLYWKSRRLGRRAPKVRASRGVWGHAPPENFETWGAYHLHGKLGNSGWKMKWYIPFHLKHFRNYRLST